MSELLPNPRICGGCGESGCSLKCACKLVYYCGRLCQKKDWPSHKKKCTAALDKKAKQVKREHGKDHFDFLEARMTAGQAHFDAGRFESAERCFLEGRRICMEQREICDNIMNNENIAVCCLNLGNTYRILGRHHEALRMHEESLGLHVEIYGPRSQETAKILQCMSANLHAQGKIEQALSRLTRRTRSSRKSAGQRLMRSLLC